jgi:hypothetical protein
MDIINKVSLFSLIIIINSPSCQAANTTAERLGWTPSPNAPYGRGTFNIL